MKISLLTISKSEVVSSIRNNTIFNMASIFYKSGNDVVSCDFMTPNSQLLRDKIGLELLVSDAVILICQNEADKFYMVKKVICEFFSTNLKISEFAKNNMDEVLKNLNVPIRKEEISLSQMPSVARSIKNPYSMYQGCLCEGGGKMIFLLPLEEKELTHMFFSSVLPYILEKEKKENKSYIFKTFGIKFSELSSVLREEILNNYEIEVVFSEKLLLGEVIVNVKNGVRSDAARRIVDSVYNKILPYIYTDRDESEGETLKTILEIQNKKIAFGEDFTSGKLSSKLKESDKEMKNFVEGYVTTSPISKIKNLGVDEKLFKTTKLDYNEIAYEMALGVLENSGADIVCCNTGDIESGDLYFSIGSSEGIHIFNEKVYGDINDKIDMACNAIFFKLIKKLIKNDLNLCQDTV